MNTPWRILILVVFLGTVNANGSISTRELGSNHTNMVLIIVGALMAAICISLIAFVCYITSRRRQLSVEDGIESPASSSRRWFSRFGRYRRDGKSKPSTSEKDVAYLDEKASSVPRYLRVNSALEHDMSKAPSPTVSIIRALPVVPQSAHVHDKKKPTKMLASAPTSAPLSHADSIRSIDRTERRKVQVSPRSVTSSPLGQGGRKRDLLPNLFRFGAKAPPPAPAGARHPSYWQNLTPDELSRRMQEKKRAVAVLEARSRVHAHHAHSANTSSISSCEIDEKLQSEIAELRHEVKVLNNLLPQGPLPSYNSAF